MDYRNILPLLSHTQEFSTDYWNDFGYWNDGTFWYEKTPTYTARVTAYAAATGITDYTILDPLNIFDLGLTYYGLDTIMKALYPMVTDKTSQSDMANQMKYNFMNPLDTNAAFRLQWFGGWVYSRTGALPNGTNAYADTKLVPSINLSNLNTHLSYYSRTNITSDVYTMTSTDPNNQLALYANYLGTMYSTMYSGFNGRVTGAVSRGDGFFIGSRTSSISHKIYHNTTLVNTSTTSTSLGSLPNVNMLIGGLNVNLTDSKKECAFASIGDGLTDSQAQIFSSLVNNLQIALNRAVY